MADGAVLDEDSAKIAGWEWFVSEAVISAFVGTFLTSTASLAGIMFFNIRTDQKKLLAFLLNFSAGAMLADVFLHILPHASNDHGADHSHDMFCDASADPHQCAAGGHSHGHDHDHGHDHGQDHHDHGHDHDHSHGHSHGGLGSSPEGLLMIGIILFMVLDRITAWIADAGGKDVHSAAYLNLLADAVHNVVDGMAIGAAFLTDKSLGRATVVAVWLHELPQELGDYAILTSSGLSRRTALALNFLCGLLALGGTAATVILGAALADSAKVILPVAAGGMLYISLSSVLPEANAADPGSDAALSKVAALVRQLFAVSAGIACLTLLALFE